MTALQGSVDVALVAAKGSTSSSASSSSILIFVLIGAAFYFFFYRPQKKKQLAARTQTNSFEVGDEVVTAGGIVGHVLDITDDRVTLETSVGASFVVLKPYVLRKLESAEPPPDVVGPADESEEGENAADRDDHPDSAELADGDDADKSPPPQDAPPTGATGADVPAPGTAEGTDGSDNPPII